MRVFVRSKSASASGDLGGLLQPERVCFVLVFLVLLGLVVCLPFQLFGDAAEYLGMTASLLRTHNLAFEHADLEACAEMVPPETYVRDSKHGHLTRLNRYGDRVWGTHSIYYSILGLPFVALFGARGLLVLNALCFVFATFLLYEHLRERNSSIASLCLATSCIGLSSATCHVFWIHTEVLVMTMVWGGLYFGFKRNIVATGICLGIAAGIKPMLVLALIPIGLWHIRSLRGVLASLAMGFVTLAAMSVQLIYNLVQFGALHGLGGWLSVEYISLHRVLTLWFDPREGMVWFFPAVAWCMIRNRQPLHIQLCLIATAVLVSVACCVGSPFLTHQIGWRYSMLLFPFFLIMAGQWKGQLRDWAALAFMCLFGGALLLHAAGNSNLSYGRANVPRRIADATGIPTYPESFFSTPNRWGRYVALDYLDSEKNIRNKRTQIQVRDAEEGELVAKLYLEPGMEPGPARLSHVFGKGVSAELTEGRVTTLLLPMRKRDFVQCVFHDLHNQRVPVARLDLRVPVSVKSGPGELYWQKRWFVRPSEFLYLAGPLVLDVCRSRSAILASFASEDLAGGARDAVLPAPGPTNATDVQWDESDCVEGSCSCACRINADREAAGAFAGMEIALPIDVSAEFSRGEQIQLSGWFKVESPSKSAKPVILLVWLDDHHAAVARGGGVPQPVVAGPNGWGFFRMRLVPPEGGKGLRISMGLRGGSGTFKVDDFIVRRFVPPW